MATIVDTLFGVSPERLEQQRAAAADAQALAFAKLSPIEKASFGVQRGAYDLAGALGGALGGQDPELQRVTMRQQIAGQIDYNDDASMQQGIIALRDANDPAGAMQLQQILLSQQAKRAGISKDEAAAKASLATATRERGPTGDVAKAIRVGEITRTLQIPEISEIERIGLEAELSVLSPTKAKEPTTDAITNAAAFAASKGPIGTPEYTAAFQSKHAELTSKAPNIDTVGVAKGTGQPVYFDKFTNEQFTVGTGSDGKPVRQLYVGGVDRTTAKTTVDARNIAEDSYAKEVGLDVAKRDTNIINNAEAVAGTLPKMYETRKLLETGALNTGFAAELQQVVDRAKTKILADKAAGKRVTDTEYLDALLGSDVFPQISALGIGARGLDTPAEREFLRQVITGTISLDRETLKRMTDFRIKAAERAVGSYNEKLMTGDFDKFQKISGRTLKPIAVTPHPVSGQGDGTPGNPIKLR